MSWRIYKSDNQQPDHRSDSPIVGVGGTVSTASFIDMLDGDELVQYGYFDGDACNASVTLSRNDAGAVCVTYDNGEPDDSYSEVPAADKLHEVVYHATQYLHSFMSC